MDGHAFGTNWIEQRVLSLVSPSRQLFPVSIKFLFRADRNRYLQLHVYVSIPSQRGKLFFTLCFEISPRMTIIITEF